MAIAWPTDVVHGPAPNTVAAWLINVGPGTFPNVAAALQVGTTVAYLANTWPLPSRLALLLPTWPIVISPCIIPNNMAIAWPTDVVHGTAPNTVAAWLTNVGPGTFPNVAAALQVGTTVAYLAK
ncbi:hypothetical protein FRX31_003615 [Thalictrum thalictroides]|uniref:Uncharacterized protein n=1 Tax=Thalictrum thalictroides TaxID=46969 RepID=A0A7J6XAZ5_THATH|nr:hypothetical protein FRX31_003615 [Thalictrum thalictroides]